MLVYVVLKMYRARKPTAFRYNDPAAAHFLAFINGRTDGLGNFDLAAPNGTVVMDAKCQIWKGGCNGQLERYKKIYSALLRFQ